MQVLAPTSGPITASFDAFGKSSTEIDVQVPSLAFTFSPTTVRLILKVVNSLQPSSTVRYYCTRVLLCACAYVHLDYHARSRLELSNYVYTVFVLIEAKFNPCKNI